MIDIHDNRELNKIGLDTYLISYEFPDLEIDINYAINKIENEIILVFEELKKNPEGSNLSDTDSAILDFHYTEKLNLLEERLYGIYEMIIVSDYKEFETILKQLLKNSLELNKKNLYFKEISTFLKSKGINISQIDCYNDINDLRKLNNYIKHSKISNIPNDLKQIKEFRNIDTINYTELKDFHRRVQGKRYNFIFDLKDKIFEYLYEFSDDRINNIAVRMHKRMDSNQINKLIKKLNDFK